MLLNCVCSQQFPVKELWGWEREGGSSPSSHFMGLGGDFDRTALWAWHWLWVSGEKRDFPLFSGIFRSVNEPSYILAKDFTYFDAVGHLTRDLSPHSRGTKLGQETLVAKPPPVLGASRTGGRTTTVKPNCRNTCAAQHLLMQAVPFPTPVGSKLLNNLILCSTAEVSTFWWRRGGKCILVVEYI